MEKLKTNTFGTIFEPFCRYLSNNLGSTSVSNVKISLVCLERKWALVAKSGTFTAVPKRNGSLFFEFRKEIANDGRYW